jgi:hypothetical protein
MYAYLGDLLLARVFGFSKLLDFLISKGSKIQSKKFLRLIRPDSKIRFQSSPVNNIEVRSIRGMGRQTKGRASTQGSWS